MTEVILMQLIDKYLPYWPVIAASLLFLALGLWWRLTSARAMELAPKDPDWVKNYRAGGFPLRRMLPARPKLRIWALLIVLLVAGAFAAGKLVNMGMIYVQNPGAFYLSRYTILKILLYVVGACAVYLLLNLLFDSGWISLPGALLFAVSAARGHGEGCFLAVSLLFLLLYLRAEKPGFPAELLYLCAVLCLAALAALQPGLIWIFLFYPPVHWYKLRAQRRERKLRGGILVLALLAALLIWALTLAAAAMLQRFLWFGFHLSALKPLVNPGELLRTGQVFLRYVREALFTRPSPGITVDLMVDAPLFGFGFWGLCAAWRLAKKRRDARGVFVLLVLAALLIAWVLTGRYALSLALSLTAACVLREADLGKKRWPVIVLTLAAALWSVGIQIAAWFVPLCEGLVERLV